MTRDTAARTKSVAASARQVLIGAAVVLLCLAATAGAIARADTAAETFKPAPASQRYGVNAAEMFLRIPGLNVNALTAQMRAGGIQIARTDGVWDRVQPTAADGSKGIYHWATLDHIVTVLASNGVRWLPIIDYSAPWAASLQHVGMPDLQSPPRNDADFARFAAALVTRYGPHGSFWDANRALPRLPVNAVEVWNEEDNKNYWHATPNAARYEQLYEATRSAVHGADPDVEALVGGLSQPKGTFLAAVYAAAGNRRGMFDGVAIHVGGDAATVLSNVVFVRHMLDSHGDIDTPLDLTEIGWPSLFGGLGLTSVVKKTYVPDSERATYLQGSVNELAGSDCGVERILPFTWVSPMKDPLNTDDWFGLVSPSGAETATAQAYTSTIRRLEGQTPLAHATSSWCGRTMRLHVSGFHRTIRSGRHRKIVRRQACTRINADTPQAPVDHATVFVDQVGAGSRRRLASLLTDGDGNASTCTKAARKSSTTFAVTAQRADFSNVPGGQATVRIP